MVAKPLDGVRVLAIEQMQALPYATQVLARFGADVVKVEPIGGESGRGALPAISDPEGRSVGATFLRNNLGKRSVAIDLKSDAGRELVLRLVPAFDVVAENFRPGTMDRLGLGYDELRRVHPKVIHLSVSGFGDDSPYRDRAAYSAIVEAMSGIYEWKRRGDARPVANPVGALADIGSGLFGVIGVLAALRQRDRDGVGQHVDVAMLDAAVAMTDVVAGFWSLGAGTEAELGIGIVDTFAASDGWFVLQVVREHHFERLVEIIGRPELVDDPRVAERTEWESQLDGVLRPAIESWASTRTREEACAALAAEGIAAGPCLRSEEVVRDPHLAKHEMLVEMARPDGVEQPVLVPGDPVKLSASTGPADGDGGTGETRVPWLGEHTDDVLRDELGLSADELAKLRADAVIA
jgi:crotonobetainyl-CoA:carnitine CoA-transferase CaiB-like acyl-CoA transferase